MEGGGTGGWVAASDTSMATSTVFASHHSPCPTPRYGLLRLRKGFNDALRTYSEQMVEFGIPGEEVEALGFQEFSQKGASTGPAGLVVK